jgi:hypothetical protein
MKEPYMKQYQLLILALFVVTISLNAMDKKETSAPIETSGKGSNTRALHTSDNQYLNADEITAHSAPAALVTAAALVELSDSDDQHAQDASRQSQCSDVHKTNAYSHNGSWEGVYHKAKSHGEDRYNRKTQYKQKDREKKDREKDSKN